MNALYLLALPTMIALSSTSPAAESNPVFPEAEWQHSSPESQGIRSQNVREAFDYLRSVMGEDGVSQSILIRNGYIIWAGDDIDNQHPIWSCTKSFLSTCLGLLWDDGKCTPQDLAVKYLPELAKDYPRVTLEHLATFTSGMSLEDGTLDPGVPDYPVGTAMHYSRQSDMLALILTKIAGEPLQELFRRRIGDPIGIDPNTFEWRSSHTVDELRVNGGSGHPESGISTTARNMARFGWLYANGGNWNGKQLISKRYIEYATVPLVGPNMKPHDPDGWYGRPLLGRYGLNWWVNGTNANGERLWPAVPGSTFAAQGNRNNICIIVPEWKLVLVRLGEDDKGGVPIFDGAFEILGKGMQSP